MSKARDEYINSLRSNICYNYQTYILRDNAHMYICELEQRVSQLIDSKVKLESEKAELVRRIDIIGEMLSEGAIITWKEFYTILQIKK